MAYTLEGSFLEVGDCNINSDMEFPKPHLALTQSWNDLSTKIIVLAKK